MPQERYRALLLDLDGTLVDDSGGIRPRVLASLHEARERGVIVMVATGRSEGGAQPVLEELGVDFPALVFNGAGIWCPRRRVMIEEQLLADHCVQDTLAFSDVHGHLPVVMGIGAKFACAPRNDEERRAVAFLEDLQLVERGALPLENLLRITLFTAPGQRPAAWAERLEAHLARPVYLTHFPLRCLADHRTSSLGVVDVQPPSRGKAEALRWLEEQHGVKAGEVVAVGDAGNDDPMLLAAGLGVAMGNAVESTRAIADRVIGENGSDAIADLVEELFLGDAVPRAAAEPTA